MCKGSEPITQRLAKGLIISYFLEEFLGQVSYENVRAQHKLGSAVSWINHFLIRKILLWHALVIYLYIINLQVAYYFTNSNKAYRSYFIFYISQKYLKYIQHIAFIYLQFILNNFIYFVYITVQLYLSLLILYMLYNVVLWIKTNKHFVKA